MYEGNDRPPEVWFLENTVWNAQLRSKIPGLDIEISVTFPVLKLSTPHFESSEHLLVFSLILVANQYQNAGALIQID